MKETVRSLRIYFGLVGVVNGLLSALVLSDPHAEVLSKAMSLMSLAVAGAALYVAFALPTLLRTAPMIVVAVIGVFPSAAVLTCGVRLLATGQLAWVNPVVSIAIAAYLYVNVRRLAKEAAALPK